MLGFLVATVQGGAQALSRSLFATLIPSHKAGEMFGFFGVFDRFGGAIGIVRLRRDAGRDGLEPAAPSYPDRLLRPGAILLSRVDVERGRRLAREAEAAAHEVRPSLREPPPAVTVPGGRIQA